LSSVKYLFIIAVQSIVQTMADNV